MRRHRQLAAPPESSSSDDEDAFAAFSSKKKKKQKKSLLSRKDSSSKLKPESTSANNVLIGKETNKSSTSNNASGTKRHHGASSARQAKMDALLIELAIEEKKAASAAANCAKNSGQGPGATNSFSFSRPPPDKRGSFVEEGEEHLTTNIFVSNLAPSVTEEALTDLFRQFGDLYSVKIMWPRTVEERARNRNTGFVCFMTRDDAQEAMDAYNDEIVFGRRIALRWGKNVKKTVKRGTGGVPIPPIRKRKSNRAYIKIDDNSTHSPNIHIESDEVESSEHLHYVKLNTKVESKEGIKKADPDLNKTSSSKISFAKIPPYPIYDPLKHGADAVRVRLPSNLYRLQFISTVASFVAKDGSVLEKKLIDRESSNPLFSFLDSESSNFTNLNKNWDDLSEAEKEQIHERLFYRWRVFSFTQGDGMNHWRTEPFLMFNSGKWWIPPALNEEAAQLEVELVKQKEDDIVKKIDERRRLSTKKGYMTGRQLEHVKFGNVPRTNDGGGVKLNEWERDQFDILLKKKLCASKESICEAMSFCFDKSGAAVEIAEKLKESLLENESNISVDTRIARLFLVSDILFNSQQPGIRNAFRYRDSIESMAPEIFSSLGKHGNGKVGRMTMNKLRQAVNTVLKAWSNWSVYNSHFIDELQMKFEGKEVVISNRADEKEPVHRDVIKPDIGYQGNGDIKMGPIQSKNTPMSLWKPAEDNPEPNHTDGKKLNDDLIKYNEVDSDLNELHNSNQDTQQQDHIDGVSLSEDEEFVGEPFSDGEFERFGITP